MALLSIKYANEENRVIESIKLRKGVYSILFKSSETEILKSLVKAINIYVVRDDYTSMYSMKDKLGEGSFSEVYLVGKK